MPREITLLPYSRFMEVVTFIILTVQLELLTSDYRQKNVDVDLPLRCYPLTTEQSNPYFYCVFAGQDEVFNDDKVCGLGGFIVAVGHVVVVLELYGDGQGYSDGRVLL